MKGIGTRRTRTIPTEVACEISPKSLRTNEILYLSKMKKAKEEALHNNRLKKVLTSFGMEHMNDEIKNLQQIKISSSRKNKMLNFSSVVYGIDEGVPYPAKKSSS